MSHDPHSGHNKQSDINQSKTSLGSSFWLVVIIVVLFIAALNFVNVISNSEEKKEPQKAEAPAAAGKDEKNTPVANQIPNVDSGSHKMSSDSAVGK